VAVTLPRDAAPSAAFAEVDAIAGGALARAVANAGFLGDRGTLLNLHGVGPYTQVIVIGTGTDAPSPRLLEDIGGLVGQAGVLSAAPRIDVLVNNAGIQTRATPIWEYSVETWRSIIDINLTGVFLCTRAVAGHMKDRASGRIINIASVSSKHGGPNICAYAAAKAGVVSLTKSVGKELAPFGVLVNAITPTMIETDLMRSTGAEFVEQGKARIPMGRFGKIEEVAAMVSWLAGRECSFSTAAVFDLSGGTANY